jgi:preprotein translocase subunit SecG
MNDLTATIAILISIALIVIVLLQVKGTTSSLFGASTSTFRTRRGLERRLFQATIILAMAFVAVSLINARLFG